MNSKLGVAAFLSLSVQSLALLNPINSRVISGRQQFSKPSSKPLSFINGDIRPQKINTNFPQSYSVSTSRLFSDRSSDQQIQVILDPNLTDERITALFAWISCAFRGEANYNNLMLGIAAIFDTNLDPDSAPRKMAQNALSRMPGLKLDDKPMAGMDLEDFYVVDDEICVGDAIPLFQREQASLGAMGAAQWTGQWKTRPHALLEIRNTLD